MNQETLKYMDHNVGEVSVTVTEATVLVGIRRTRMKLEQRGTEEPDLDRRLLRLYTYPDLMAATVSAEGIPWPLDFEEFLGLPDHLVGQWETLVYRLNPHWLPVEAEEGEAEDAKKKAAPPSTAD